MIKAHGLKIVRISYRRNSDDVLTKVVKVVRSGSALIMRRSMYNDYAEPRVSYGPGLLR